MEMYVPNPDDVDPEAEEIMVLGRSDVDPNNDLRDPYLLTSEGHEWLRENASEGEIDEHRE